MDAIIRRARPTDSDDVWVLARAFATSFQPERGAFDRTFASLDDAPHSLVLVAESSGLVIGYLVAHVHETFFANGPVAWVEEIMVAEAHRRAGIGQALMAGAEAWAGDRGAAYVSLATRRAGSFYLALGFEESAVFYKRPVERP